MIGFLGGNCRGYYWILIGILWGVFFPRPHLEEVFTGNFLESPSRFFSRELKQNGVVFGSDVVLMGECVGEIKGLFQGHFENKKRPHIVQNGRCKVFIFCLSLEFHRLPNFAFCKGLDDAQISQKQKAYSHSLTKSISGVYKWRISGDYRQFRP